MVLSFLKLYNIKSNDIKSLGFSFLHFKKKKTKTFHHSLTEKHFSRSESTVHREVIVDSRVKIVRLDMVKKEDKKEKKIKRRLRRLVENELTSI